MFRTHFLLQGVIVSFIILIIIARYALFQPQDVLRVIFLDVGQGDSILIQTPLGKNILIDTGPTNNLDKKISTYMLPAQRSLDAIILTHPDLDHIGGTLNLIRRYSIGFVSHSGLLAGSTAYSVIAQELKSRNIPTQSLSLGNYLFLEPGLFLYVLSPQNNLHSFDANEHSLVLKLVYYDTSIILTGDASKNTELELVNIFGDIISADILKLGHHGSQTSTSINFLEAVQPKYGIISAGCDNRYGHPHVDVLSNLFQFNVHILDTCSQGDIIFTSNGDSWSLIE